MNILLLGGAGFIGTNLTIKLAEDVQNEVTLIDRKREYFVNLEKYSFENVKIKVSSLDKDVDFDEILSNQDIVYHLISSNIPSTSNQNIIDDIQTNVMFSAKLLEACVKNRVKKVVFLSSGGTVYGKEGECPLKEDTITNPISTYGLQKITVEKLLYLYNHIFGLDYQIIRLANPYGPYQRPNGVLGAVTTFTYKALKGEEITVFGDGSVIRDYIYIDDAIRAIINIANGKSKYHIYNIGCGYGISIKQVLETIETVLGCKLNVIYKEGRTVDVPVNYLDISRYESEYGKLNPISLSEGVLRTIKFMQEEFC